LNKGGPFPSQSFASPVLQEFSKLTERSLDEFCTWNVGFDPPTHPVSHRVKLLMEKRLASQNSRANYWEPGIFRKRESGMGWYTSRDNGTEGRRTQVHRLTVPSQTNRSDSKLLFDPRKLVPASRFSKTQESSPTVRMLAPGNLQAQRASLAN
jgi:hypothetical protein